MALAILLWVADAVVDTIFFADQSFFSVLITDVPAYKLYVRTTNAVIVLLGGLAVAIAVARKRSQTALLEEARSRYELIVEGASGGIWDWDIPNRRVRFSSGWKAMRGYTDAEVGDDETEWSEGIHPDDAPMVMAAVQAVFEGRTKVFELEYRVRCKNGSYIWIFDRVKVVCDEAGHVARMAGSEIDISARKLAEQNVRESEERYRMLFETAGDAIFIVQLGEDGKPSITDCNPRVFEMFRCTQEEVIGLTPMDFSPATQPDGRPSHEGIREDVTAAMTGIMQRFEWQSRRLDGELFDTEVTLNRIDLDQKSCIQTVVRDVSERKKSERALRDSEERLRMVADFTYDWEYWRSPEGKYIYVSPSCQRITGYLAEEFYQNAALMKGIIHPADWRQVGRYCDVSVDSKEPSSVQFRILDRNGVERWVEDVYQSVYSTEGRYLGRRGSIRDITQRKRREHETLEQHERLQRQQAALVKLTADEAVTAGGFRDAIRIITEEASRAMEVERTSVWLLNDDHTELRCVDLFTLSAQAHSDELVLATGNYPRYFSALKDEWAIDAHDVRTDPRTSEYTDGYLDPRGITSLLDAAIRVSGKVIGIICHEHVGEMRTWAPDEVAFAVAMADQVAQAFVNSEREQTEAENARLAAFPRENPNFILVCDRDGNVTYSNPAAIRLMNELGLETPLGLLPDNHSVLIEDCISSDGCTLVSEACPGERVLSWSYHYASSTETVQLYGQDDTARQRNEMERARLYTAIEQAGESIIITDPAGDMVYVNQAFERMTGYSREEAIGQNPRMLMNGDQDDTFYRKMWDTLTAGKSWSGELVNKGKDGSRIVVRANIAPMYAASGELLGYVESKMDITEQKRIQEDLQRAKRLETAGQLAGQIAHDFNNLLGPLMAYPELIGLMIEPNEKVSEMLQDMERAAGQIADINQDLLTLGRRGHYNVHALSLNKIVEDTLRALALPQGVQTERRLADDLCAVKGGGAQITRILTNLLINAVEAMNDRGVLTVTTENVVLEEVGGDYRSIPPGCYVRLDVADTGTGIAADVLDHIFEPFFTTRVTDKKRGSGLGLSVVHAVMEDHEGYIDVQTEPGRGTTFRLYFPLATEEKPEVVEPKAGDLAVGQGESVLVIDDDAMQLRIASRLLDQLGYRATTAGSGEEAIAYVTEHPQDVLLIDMVMGGIDGTETLRRIKDIYPDQLAVICSGFAANDRVDEAMRMGAQAFLSKPIQIGDLAKTIRAALNARCRTGAAVE